MLSCESCTTTILLEDEGLRLAGEQGVLHQVPMLFGLGDEIQINAARYQILGQARFSYGRGTWDEFWALREDQESAWISVDEGDLILQQSLTRSEWPRYDGYLQLGSTVEYDAEIFAVTEIGSGECTGLQGSFGHTLYVGETYQFYNLQGDRGRVLSAEMQEGSREWFLGRWLDPFEVEVLHR